MLSFGQIYLQMKALTLFRNLLKDAAVKAFMNLLSADEASTAEKVEKYAQFVHLLFQQNENFTQYMWNLIVFDENIYVQKCAQKEPVSSMMEQCLLHELKTLQAASQIAAQQIKQELGCEFFLPEWGTNASADFAQDYQKRMQNLSAVGYGIYADNIMFSYREGRIVPVKFRDSIRLKNLTGYAAQRQRIIDNTLAFLEGKPAANTLLYGDAGTGKSSTVKAVVNELADKGLRMVEVRKNDLLELPQLIEQLAQNPLKFILFIDDLSFSRHNEEIGALKAILEGSVSAKTSNIVIYTTSNRRHLLKETFLDRDGDDLHRNETIQEQTSLASRFGLAVLFAKPSKEEYLQIVHELMKAYALYPVKDIEVLAERYAIERGGRSGRAARQFVESLKSMQ